MHIRDERVYQFCHELYPLILQADVYVGEMDLSQTEVQLNGIAYDMQSRFTPSAFAKIRKQLLKSFQMDVAR